jgi:hypothetical protein
LDLRRNGQGGDLTPKKANNNQEITPASQPVPSVPLPIPADLAARLRQTHSRLARQVLRANAGDGPRMDVVMYCASALETYAALAQADQKQLLMEVATAGQKGLALNRPEAQLQLRHYRNGEPISHLQAACLLFVGLKLLLPDQESGFDFEREYRVAQGLVGR